MKRCTSLQTQQLTCGKGPEKHTRVNTVTVSPHGCTARHWGRQRSPIAPCWSSTTLATAAAGACQAGRPARRQRWRKAAPEGGTTTGATPTAGPPPFTLSPPAQAQGTEGPQAESAKQSQGAAGRCAVRSSKAVLLMVIGRAAPQGCTHTAPCVAVARPGSRGAVSARPGRSNRVWRGV